MKKFVLALTLVALVGAAVPAQADGVWGALDEAPGATLLLPYFEVEYDNPDGVTTLFSINNASATAILAHVVLWTDWSQHTLDFNVYLTGYDVVTINLRDVFNGFLPITASDGQDPTDTISPQGTFSQDINFASCSGILPYTSPALPAFNLDYIRLGHTGVPVPFLGANRCLGENYGDGVARGYVTVDTVNSCNLLFPPSPGYFQAIATFQNVLWGDFFIIDSGNNFAFGDRMVSMQADQVSAVPGDITFYGRYVAATGVDGREPLGLVWGTRYLNGGAFDGGTDLIGWRDSTANNQPVSGFSCAAGPDWAPLSQAQVVIFDEEEQPNVPEGCEISPCPTEEGLVVFPLETQRIQVGGPNLPVPFTFGWVYLDLAFASDDFVTGDVDFVPSGQLTQSYVLSNHSAEGRFQVGYPASQFWTASEGLNPFIFPLP